LPLIATRILDPSFSSDGGERRARPGDLGWTYIAAGAIALAAASALDLAADLARRAIARRWLLLDAEIKQHDAHLEILTVARARTAEGARDGLGHRG
jgi:hypothetical protein